MNKEAKIRFLLSETLKEAVSKIKSRYKHNEGHFLNYLNILALLNIIIIRRIHQHNML